MACLDGRAGKVVQQLGLACHGYESANGGLPLLYSSASQLSWVVQILPYIEQQQLYKQFHLDEPWDSPNNKPLIAKMPAVFRSPHIANAEPGKTTYLVPVGPGLIFDGPKKTKISQITDGTSNTIMLGEDAGQPLRGRRGGPGRGASRRSIRS